MELFIFGEQMVVLQGEVLLKLKILLVRGFGLLLQVMVFNNSKLIRELRLGSAPFAEVSS